MSDRTLTRRRALLLLAAGAGALALAACGQSGASSPPPGAPAGGADFSARFARFQPADEPNGDLARVVWPDFVTQAGPEVQALYAFQVVNGELMKYMPCFCGCDGNGHRNNRDCYIQAVSPDGSVVFDPMAPT